ncbi:ABC transporter permease [Helcococcus ovis]|uniref:FtsX-like permease family protein n=1 Tax=Helcococcus ovis TaxID=72026 RepID=UPI003916FB48
MKIISKLSWRYIKKNKLRTILTLLGIIISISMITSIGNISYSLITENRNSYERINGPYDFKISESSNDEEIKVNNLKDIEAVYKISRKYISRIHSKTPDLGIDNYIEFEHRNSDQEFYNKYFPKNMLLEGRLPKSENEILVPYNLKYIAPGFDKIGNTVKLGVQESLKRDEFFDYNTTFNKNYINRMENKPLLKGEITEKNYDKIDKSKLVNIEDIKKMTDIFNGDYKEYKIVGFIKEELMPGNNLSNFDTEGIESEKQISIFHGYILGLDNNINDRFDLYGYFANYDNLNKNVEKLKDITQYKEDGQFLDNRLNIRYEYIKIKDITQSKVLGSLFNVSITLIVMVSVAIILFIYNIFTTNYVERLRDLGLLKVVGFTNLQLLKMVMLDSLFYFIVSIPIGYFVGNVSMKIVFEIVNRIMRTTSVISSGNINVHFSKEVLIISVFVGFLVIFISNILSALFVFKKSPIEALNQVTKQKKKVYKPRNRRIIKKIFGYDGFLASRNIDRNRKRFIMTTISISISIVLFVVISSIMSLFDNEIVKSLENGQKSNIVLKTHKDYANNLIKDINKINGITVTEEKEIIELRANIIGDNVENKDNLNYITFEVLEDNIFENIFGKDEKRVVTNLSNLPLTDKLSNITIIPMKDVYNEEKVKIKDELIEKDAVNLNVKYIKNSNDSGLVKFYIRKSSKEEILKLEKYNFRKDVEVGIYRTKLDDKTSYEFSAVITKYPKTFTVSSVFPIIKIARLFVYGFIGLICSIGALNIINSSYSNTLTRRREFALIKAVGIKEKRLKKIVLLENLLSVIIASILSLVLSLLVFYIMYRQLLGGLPILYSKEVLKSFSISLGTWGLGILIAIILIYISVIIPYNRISKDNITEILK